MMWYAGGGIHWWGWLVGAVLMVAFWGLIIWGLWYLLSNVGRGSDRPEPGPVRRSGPREILDERLARGEISPEEYRHLVETMAAGREPSGTPPSGTPRSRETV